MMGEARERLKDEARKQDPHELTEAPQHKEAAGYGPSRRAPQDRPGETGKQEELHRLLREAARLVENGDLPGASEMLRRACELDSLQDPSSPTIPGARDGPRRNHRDTVNGDL